MTNAAKTTDAKEKLSEKRADPNGIVHVSEGTPEDAGVWESEIQTYGRGTVYGESSGKRKFTAPKGCDDWEVPTDGTVFDGMADNGFKAPH